MIVEPNRTAAFERFILFVSEIFHLPISMIDAGFDERVMEAADRRQVAVVLGSARELNNFHWQSRVGRLDSQITSPAKQSASIVPKLAFAALWLKAARLKGRGIRPGAWY